MDPDQHLQNMTSCDPAVNGFQTTNAYVLGPSGEQMTEMGVDADGNSTWQHTNVWDGGKLLATYDLNGVHFYLDDPLGTRRAQTDASGVTETDLPEPALRRWRNLRAHAHRASVHQQRTRRRNRQRLLRGRDLYCASAMGRFLSPDWSAKEEPVPYAKMDDPQSLNLYAYLLNSNPLAGVDADGHCGGDRSSLCSELPAKREKHRRHPIPGWYGGLHRTNRRTLTRTNSRNLRGSEAC